MNYIKSYGEFIAEQRINEISDALADRAYNKIEKNRKNKNSNFDLWNPDVTEKPKEYHNITTRKKNIPERGKLLYEDNDIKVFRKIWNNNSSDLGCFTFTYCLDGFRIHTGNQHIYSDDDIDTVVYLDVLPRISGDQCVKIELRPIDVIKEKLGKWRNEEGLNILFNVAYDDMQSNLGMNTAKVEKDCFLSSCQNALNSNTGTAFCYDYTKI